MDRQMNRYVSVYHRETQAGRNKEKKAPDLRIERRI